jgi:hypothetical protein
MNSSIVDKSNSLVDIMMGLESDASVSEDDEMISYHVINSIRYTYRTCIVTRILYTEFR